MTHDALARLWQGYLACWPLIALSRPLITLCLGCWLARHAMRGRDGRIPKRR